METGDKLKMLIEKLLVNDVHINLIDSLKCGFKIIYMYIFRIIEINITPLAMLTKPNGEPSRSHSTEDIVMDNS